MVTRQTWCLVVLAVAAFAGCWAAGRAGAPQLSAGFGLVGGGFCAAVGWFWSDEGASE